MIDRVSGNLIATEPGVAIVDVGGVAFRVEVTPTCADALPVGEPVTLLTHFMLVGQDTQPRLFGFRTPEARHLFMLLRAVSGVGPAMALRILGAQPTPGEVAAAIAQGDKAGIKVKGVGPKTAARVITELKDKMTSVLQCLPSLSISTRARRPGLASSDRQLEDAFLALKGLEFDPTRARLLLGEIRRELTDASADQLVREVLLRA